MIRSFHVGGVKQHRQTTQIFHPDLMGQTSFSLRCEPVKIEDRQGFEHLLVSGLIFLKLPCNHFFTHSFNLKKSWLQRKSFFIMNF